MLIINNLNTYSSKKTIAIFLCLLHIISFLHFQFLFKHRIIFNLFHLNKYTTYSLAKLADVRGYSDASHFIVNVCKIYVYNNEMIERKYLLNEPLSTWSRLLWSRFRAMFIRAIISVIQVCIVIIGGSSITGGGWLVFLGLFSPSRNFPRFMCITTAEFMGRGCPYTIRVPIVVGVGQIVVRSEGRRIGRRNCSCRFVARGDIVIVGTIWSVACTTSPLSWGSFGYNNSHSVVIYCLSLVSCIVFYDN